MEGKAREADATYKEVDLVRSEKKDVRRSPLGSPLGSQFDGLVGTVRADPLKTAALMEVTLSVIRLGRCTKSILRVLIGCWVYVLMYRRPIMCVLQACFHEGSTLAENVIFRLSKATLSELTCLVCLAPMVPVSRH